MAMDVTSRRNPIFGAPSWRRADTGSLNGFDMQVVECGEAGSW